MSDFNRSFLYEIALPIFVGCAFMFLAYDTAVHATKTPFDEPDWRYGACFEAGRIFPARLGPVCYTEDRGRGYRVPEQCDMTAGVVGSPAARRME